MTVQYTDSQLVTGVRLTDVPRSGQTVSGYGGKVPTRYMLKYAGRWHRVYAMAYGNSASVYIVSGGQDLFLDTDTEHRVEKHRDHDAVVTCGNCGKSWCEACDPAPSALCHSCHGRGYSTAQV
jgi:hypothetical protein